MTHPQIAQPDSVTHFLCPDGPTQNGVPVATHHLIPRAAGQTCRYCRRTEADLRSRHKV